MNMKAKEAVKEEYSKDKQEIHQCFFKVQAEQVIPIVLKLILMLHH